MAIRQQLHRQQILQLIAIVLLFVLLVTMLVTETSRFLGEASTERALVVTVPSTALLQGVLLRDEMALEATGNGPVEYLAACGERVTAGDALANVFVDDSNKNKRARAAELYAEIARLEASLAEEQAWQPLYGVAYYDLMLAASGGDLGGAAAAADPLCAALGARDADHPTAAAAVQARIDEMRDEIAYLVKYDTNPERIGAPSDGCFYPTADGLEGVLTTALAETLTPAALTSLLATPQSTRGTVGKLVLGDRFFVAVTCPVAVADELTVGETYAVRAGGNPLSLRLSRIAPEEGGDGALLLLEGDALPAALCGVRVLSVEIELGRATGIAVPLSALREEDGVTGVYVLRDGVASFRRVTTAFHGKNGCYLAQVREEEPFLQEGDRILVTARRIYEGKKIN